MLRFFGLGPTKGLQGQSGCADLPHGELRAGRLYKGPILLRTQVPQFAVQPFGGEKEEPSGLMGSGWRLWWWDIQLSFASLFLFNISSSRQR